MFVLWSSRPDPFQIEPFIQLSRSEGFENAYGSNLGAELRGLAQSGEATALVIPVKASTRQKKINGDYPCTECGKPLNTAGGLNKHLKRAHVHNNLRSCVCLHCFKRFCQRWDLDRRSVQHQPASSATRVHVAEETPLTKRRRLSSPIRPALAELPPVHRLLQRGLISSGAKSPIALGKRAGCARDEFLPSSVVASQPPAVAHENSSRRQEPRSHGLARSGLRRIE